jgi:multimeric flavodoxin WrbA
MKAAIIYWSKTGNTAKVAQALRRGLERAAVRVTLLRVEEAKEVDYYAYDLICVGFPSYRWHPPKPMDAFLTEKFNGYHREGRVKVGAPPVPGQHALIFCTYSGPHTGINEAIPAGKYAGQFFEHLGIPVVDEWYVLGEFHGSLEKSTQGREGDIRGRPDQQDLAQIERDAQALVARLRTT